MGARVGHASKDKCDPPFIPCTERSLSSPYNYFAQKFKMGAVHRHPEQKYTVSPLVATIPATNLLVVDVDVVVVVVVVVVIRTIRPKLTQKLRTR